MSIPGPILPRSISESDVLTKVDYFLDVQVWPVGVLNPRGWLGNFPDLEHEHAVHLLNAFLYFCPLFIDKMFVAAVQSISSQLYNASSPYLTFQSKWQQFIDTIIVTYVTGEKPNPSDSGPGFARKARQLLDIPEDRITTPENAVVRLLQQPGPVLFVDDFVGSGSQFWHTWTRPVPVAGSSASFQRIASVSGSSFYYCPILCTEYGYERLQNSCPQVKLVPAHILSDRYSAFAADSYIWPAHLQASAKDFIQKASFRAGIPDNGGGVDDWRGFHELGLAVAVGDTVDIVELTES